ncbi:hypothetical protein CEUSTIGMA_g7793.t1 [Chlamydomonas eustigma]|uniref:RRM domain-containing protein n=1 Tax=Chlamydomonas eustigma TaxID=1157962 RepID=A0A250XBB9_9CHLO|nr:hypothetical protein CEUSTIGMA_g7793.t1 [Chlamydomonas eustigma]|eukprot:GAX80354.1 hypothetical protein CEUSTIGMA_g7793.t1 [Chlamydomonas eustigma]
MEAFTAHNRSSQSSNLIDWGLVHQSNTTHEFGARSLPASHDYVATNAIGVSSESVHILNSDIKGSLRHIESDPNLCHSGVTAATVDDDLFGFQPETLESGEEEVDNIDKHLQYVSRLPAIPDPTATPCRSLIVRNVAADSSDDEIFNIFKSFGDVRALHTKAKEHMGVIVVSYFDLRAAVSAKSTLQGTLVNNQALEIHFSSYMPTTQDPVALSQHQGLIVMYNLDPEATNENLSWVFSKYGDVKEISQSRDRPSQKFITYYDTRHAAQALQAMNRAEHLGKLPPHITPQQAASMAYLSGSSPSLLQLATLQLQHETKIAAPLSSSALMPGSGQWDAQYRRAFTDSSAASTLFSVLSSRGSQDNLKQFPLKSSRYSQDNLLQTQQMHARGSTDSDLVHVQHMHARGSQDNLAQHQPQHYNNIQRPHSLQEAQNQLPSDLLKLAGMDAVTMSMHVSDSASSMASSVVTNAAQLLALSGGAGHLPLDPGGVASLAAAASNTGSRGKVSTSGNGMFHGAGGIGSNERSMQAQQMLMQGGLAEAANMLMTLGLGPSSAPGHAGPSGSNMFTPKQSVGPSSATVLAELIEMQARQQQQQQLAAAVQVQAQAHLAGMQAQQALAAAGGLGSGNSQHQLAAAQLLQQAAQLSMSAGTSNSAQGSSFMQNQALVNAAAMQLLQQAGFCGPNSVLNGSGLLGAAGTSGYRGSSGGGGSSRISDYPGHHRSQTAGMAGRGGEAMRGGGGGRLSRRTTDPVAEAERKMQQEKLYAMDFEKILSGVDRRTTLMIKNIPNKYTQKMLLTTIDEHFHGTYDFFYLPIDFKNKCNVGYAFINVTQPINIIPFAERFHQKKWERFNSEKICHISYARIQGRASLISHFQNSSLMHEDKRCRPILFVLEGQDATGEQEPFPAPACNGEHLTVPGSLLDGSHSRSSMSAASSHQNLAA